MDESMSDHSNKVNSIDTSNKSSTSGQGKTDIFQLEIEVPNKNQTVGSLTANCLEVSQLMIILIGLAIILALLILWCISLCLVRRWKKKYYNLAKDESCNPNCPGARRPLLTRDKSADSASASSNSYRRD